MRSQCYFQRLFNGNIEAIIQVSDEKRNSTMRVVLKKEFPSRVEAQRWWKINRDDIKMSVAVIPS